MKNFYVVIEFGAKFGSFGTKLPASGKADAKAKALMFARYSGFTADPKKYEVREEQQ